MPYTPSIQKFDLLVALLKKIEFENLIIFFQTRRGTDKISRWLTEHGQDVRFSFGPQATRQNVSLARLQGRQGQDLICHRRASRGLDISSAHRINYAPQHSEDYVHRIGRTGRARTEGEAFTFANRKNCLWFNRLKNYWVIHCQGNRR